jgi:hypothetical protein
LKTLLSFESGSYYTNSSKAGNKSMKNNKLLLVLLLIITQLTGGCAMEKKGNKFPYDTKEHIEEYILKELKQNYKINFSYSHEWEGMPYESEFSVYNNTPDNSDKDLNTVKPEDIYQ